MYIVKIVAYHLQESNEKFKFVIHSFHGSQSSTYTSILKSKEKFEWAAYIDKECTIS